MREDGVQVVTEHLRELRRVQGQDNASCGGFKSTLTDSLMLLPCKHGTSPPALERGLDLVTRFTLTT